MSFDRNVADLQTNVKREKPVAEDRVMAHFNLNTGHVTLCFGSGDNYGRVAMHTAGPVGLSGVEYRVQDSVIGEVQETGTRDVGAYVVGTMDPSVIGEGTEAVRYNPFECSHFFLRGAETPEESVVAASESLTIWSRPGENGPTGRMLASGVETRALATC